MKYSLTFTHGLNRDATNKLKEMFPDVNFTRFGAYMDNHVETAMINLFNYTDAAGYAVQMDWVEKQRAIDIGERILARYKAAQEETPELLRSAHAISCKK